MRSRARSLRRRNSPRPSRPLEKRELCCTKQREAGKILSSLSPDTKATAISRSGSKRPGAQVREPCAGRAERGPPGGRMRPAPSERPAKPRPGRTAPPGGRAECFLHVATPIRCAARDSLNPHSRTNRRGQIIVVICSLEAPPWTLGSYRQRERFRRGHAKGSSGF